MTSTLTVPTGEAVLILVVFVLAIASVTRLINGDKITDWLRAWPATKLRGAQMAYAEAMAHSRTVEAERAVTSIRRWDAAVYFLSCPWCVSMWLALATAVIPAWAVGWPWWALFPIAFATRYLVGVFARFADTEEIDIEDGPPVEADAS